MENDVTTENGEPARETADVTGYGNPPKDTQWKPGQSGNPRGRPKVTSLRELFLRVATERAGDLAGDRTRLEEVMRRAFASGSSGARFNGHIVLALARHFLPEDTDGIELDNGEYIPPKMTEARERDLTRFLGFDPGKKR